MLQDRYTTDIQGETRSKLDFLVAGFGCQTGCMQSRYNSHSKEATNCGCCEKRRQDRIEQDRTEEIAGDANGMGVYRSAASRFNPGETIGCNQAAGAISDHSPEIPTT